MTLLEAS